MFKNRKQTGISRRNPNRSCFVVLERDKTRKCFPKQCNLLNLYPASTNNGRKQYHD
ncbi:unnamed protein product [Brugia timori]|uniref:Uncharacterized protein n=1 Tax=Brugia timori TaxID=42155 RepID=A0A0R3QEP2_9BILA|nr:unnamed protein product [Brugia timori]